MNQQFAYEFDTWVLAASILDRFLVAQPIDKDIFQLSGCSAFLLAAKHEERDPPKLVELVKLCAHCYMKSDFIKEGPPWEYKRIWFDVVWHLIWQNLAITLDKFGFTEIVFIMEPEIINISYFFREIKF